MSPWCARPRIIDDQSDHPEPARQVISEMGQYLGERGAVTEVRVAIEIGLEKGDLLHKS